MKTILIKNESNLSELHHILFHNTSIDGNVVTYKDNQYKITWDKNGIDSEYDYSFYYYDAYRNDLNFTSTYDTNILTLHGERYNSLDYLFTNGIYGKTRIKSNKLGSGYISKDPTNKFLLTQTLFGWNIYGDIRVWKEYENIHNKINHEYKIGMFFSRLTPSRISLVNELKENKDVFINQFSDTDAVGKLDGVTQYNIKQPKNDFDNHPLVVGDRFTMDFFFRVLPKTKTVLSIETLEDTDSHNFLTEKTWGLIIAGIPFIPLNKFVLDFIYEIGFKTPHPFNEEIKIFDNNFKNVSNFIKNYLKNESTNYNNLTVWVNDLKEFVIQRLYSENSLLDNINFFEKNLDN